MDALPKFEKYKRLFQQYNKIMVEKLNDRNFQRKWNDSICFSYHVFYKFTKLIHMLGIYKTFGKYLFESKTDEALVGSWKIGNQ